MTALAAELATIGASSCCERAMRCVTSDRVPTPSREGDTSAPSVRAQGESLVAAGPLTFRDVYDRHFAFVWRYAANRRVPPMAIDDVVQEVFVVVHHRLSSFEGRSSIKTWLAGIAHNVVRSYVRRPGNRPTGEHLDEENQLRSDGVSPAEALERKATLRLLDELLDKMTEIQREVFILYEIEQLSAVEIAEALGLNENTIRTRLLAARKVFQASVVRARARQTWGERER